MARSLQRYMRVGLIVGLLCALGAVSSAQDDAKPAPKPAVVVDESEAALVTARQLMANDRPLEGIKALSSALSKPPGAKPWSDVQRAALLGGLAEASIQAERPARAIQTLEQQIALLGKLEGDKAAEQRAVAWATIAQVHGELGRLAEMAAAIKQGEAVAKARSNKTDTLEWAALRLASAELNLLKGNTKAAKVYGQAGLRYLVDLSTDSYRDPDVAAGLLRLAAFHRAHGEMDTARRAANSAVSIQSRLTKSQPSRARVLSYLVLAQSLGDVGRLSDQFEYLETARRDAHALADERPTHTMAKVNLAFAQALALAGRVEEAARLGQAAVAMMRQLHGQAKPISLARALVDQAALLRQAQRPAEAVQLISEAWNITKANKAGNYLPLNTQAGHELARCVLALGKMDQAVEILKQVTTAEITANRAFGRRALEADRERAILLGALDRENEALGVIERGVDAVDKVAGAEAWRHHQVHGWVLNQLDRSDDAIAAYQKAVAGYDVWRDRLGGTEAEQFTLFTHARQVSPRPGLAWLYAKTDQLYKAVEAIEADRSYTLVQLLARHRTTDPGGLLDPVIEVAQEKGDQKLLQSAQLSAKNLRITSAALRKLRELNASQQTPQMAAYWQRSRSMYNQARRMALSMVAQHAPSKTTLATVAEIRAMLGPRDVVIYYLPGAEQTLILTVGRDKTLKGVQRATWPDGSDVTEAALAKAVGQYLQSLQIEGALARGIGRERPPRPANTLDPGYRLFRALMPDDLWKQAVESQAVYIVPSGALAQLPFEALPIEPPKPKQSAGDKTYWLDKGPMIVVAPSMTVMLDRRAARDRQIAAAKQGEGASHALVALGDPIYTQLQRKQREAGVLASADALRFGDDLDPLPGTRKEVQAIARSLADASTSPVVQLLGEQATAARLFAEAPKARFLHIATHGLVESGPAAMYSRLALTLPDKPTFGDAGVLTLLDLFDRWGGHLANTELVVLSACDTLGGDAQGANVQAGEGVFGLPWGFMYAGSPAVVASLWPVDDQKTAELMGDFYRRLAKAQDGPNKHLAKLHAFTEARRALRARQPEPYFWSPFIYMGDPR